MDVPNITPRTQALLLLCGHFGKQGDTTVKPLSLKEYNALAEWLHGEQMSPEDLLHRDGEQAAAASGVVKDASGRLPALLARGMALAFASDEWGREGVWVLGRGDDRYPRALRARLGRKAPVVLYGVGDRALLNTPMIGAVGSRDADAEALGFARTLGARAAEAGWAVVSGGAKGIDQEAMFGAMEAGGWAVGVLAEGVSKPSRSRLFRDAISNGALTLVSTLVPGARWRVGHAMGRNKYIYGLSRATVVGSSGLDGGTWTGALENLENGWVPLWVRSGESVPEGNTALLSRGASSLLDGDLNAPGLVDRLVAAQPTAPPRAGVDMPKRAGKAASVANEPTLFDEPNDERSPEPAPVDTMAPEPPLPAAQAATLAQHRDAFYAVWGLMESVLREPQTADQVAEQLGLVRTQAQTWLQRAVDENLVVKQTRPVRYRLA